MTGQEVKKRKKLRDGCVVSVNWQYVNESSPAFRRLMTLLLQPREEQREMGNGERDAKGNQ
jgi:hypothetical protein